MRKFNVIVQRPGKPALKYPDADGHSALKCMQTLTKRGLTCIAMTYANKITEHLTLADMADIYTQPIQLQPK